MQTIKTIFEDDGLLVIDKPAGLVVDRSETQKGEVLADILKRDFGIKLERGGIVHRLDKDTSGLLLVAKNQEALEKLQAEFKERRVKKQYLTLVHGSVHEAGLIEGAVGRNPKSRHKFAVLETEGKEAATEYKPVDNFQFSKIHFQTIFNDLNKNQARKLVRMGYDQFTLLECKPLTGRTHQIRVHLKYLGHPVVADETYAGRKVYRLDHRWCPRQFLHAQKLGFYHPESGEWLEFESQLPQDLQQALEKLEKTG